MPDALQHLNDLKDIKKMMERSSRFISLSGLSGVSAGICALIGAWFANETLNADYYSPANGRMYDEAGVSRFADGSALLFNRLFLIAAATFIAAFVLAFVFTYIRSKRAGLAIWGSTARRLMFNVSIPMLAGGIFIIHLVQSGAVGMIAPACLIFYGLALVNASKYSLEEIRYLGYGELLLGVISCWFVEYGLHFWAAGFGVLHIIYGALMWWRYERAD
ncbi:hypothetical protein EXU57_17910 [Segetibacter sp. 3557_3]|uniref:hypothetical protein n=1 Tax=Segetibacter sp. 3557_3 TaxID=2547429 RepID=UPI001058ADA4|nr:hypothetical protein [Segetibacter sp. 3557_3]TDH23347.1 hypothetical protein EXU57_17910 [Segetibacter sp. 3557_3]